MASKLTVLDQADLMEALFEAIDHVGVAVADFDEAVRYYADVFGMRVAHEEINEEQGVREAMLSVGDSGSSIQLLAPLSDASPIAKFLEQRGPGIQQLAYRVRDIDGRLGDLARTRRPACCTTSRSAARPARG